jgi:isopenicillin N synthase-like dioxygenase
VFDFMKPRTGKADINQWPDNQSFQDAMIHFFDAASAIAERTLALLYKALTDRPSNTAELPGGDSENSTVRLNYYPLSDPLTISEQAATTPLGSLALGQHTDPGVLTLLLQDDTGGLQTYSQGNGWIDIQPCPGSIVVNLGDAMQVWSNDTYKAALHRVRPVKEKARFSTPYFFNPDNDATLKPLSQLSDKPAVYRSFKWRDYIKARVEDNYTDLGDDDIQIDQFRQ